MKGKYQSSFSPQSDSCSHHALMLFFILTFFFALAQVMSLAVTMAVATLCRGTLEVPTWEEGEAPTMRLITWHLPLAMQDMEAELMAGYNHYRTLRSISNHSLPIQKWSWQNHKFAGNGSFNKTGSLVYLYFLKRTFYANRASGVYIFIYVCTINCKMAVRIPLKSDGYDIQVSKINIGYVLFVHTPLFKCSN